MNRTLLVVLFSCLCLTGCTRSADPLDWKIQADSPAELQDWLGKNTRAMRLELAGEVTACLNNIRTDTPLGSTGKQRDYLFCQRIDGRTVRDALIEGHELANQMLRARIANESNAVVRLLSTADTLSPEQLKKHEDLMNAHLAVRGNWERHLKQGEGRIAKLRAGKATD